MVNKIPIRYFLKLVILNYYLVNIFLHILALKFKHFHISIYKALHRIEIKIVLKATAVQLS